MKDGNSVILCAETVWKMQRSKELFIYRERECVVNWKIYTVHSPLLVNNNITNICFHQPNYLFNQPNPGRPENGGILKLSKTSNTIAFAFPLSSFPQHFMPPKMVHLNSNHYWAFLVSLLFFFFLWFHFLFSSLSLMFLFFLFILDEMGFLFGLALHHWLFSFSPFGLIFKCYFLFFVSIILFSFSCGDRIHWFFNVWFLGFNVDL